MAAQEKEALERSAGALLVIAMLSWLLSGCTSVKHTFTDVPAEQVWTAMVAVAEHPRYDDWHLAENDVWVDQPAHRIEVYRRLQRVLYRPAAKPFPQQQAWRFQIEFEPDDGAAPEAVFTSRGFNIPAYAWAEGDRYFADVRDILAGLPPASTAPLPSAAASPPPAPPEQPAPPAASPNAPQDLMEQMIEPVPAPLPAPAPPPPVLPADPAAWG